MKVKCKIWLLLCFNVIVTAKLNITSFVRSFERSHSKLKDICHETVVNCTKINEILPNSTCLDLELSYEFAYESLNYQIDLDHWLPMQAIPHCWSHLQKLMCSLKYAECIESSSNWLMKKPAQDICLATRRGCPLLLLPSKDNTSSTTVSSSKQSAMYYSLVDETPPFLDCKKYSSKCPIDSHTRMIRKRDHSNGCKWPMVRTDEPSLWIKGFTGCSFGCKTPFFSKEEYQQTKTIFGVLGIIFFLLNVFALTTLALHQQQHRKYNWHPLLLSLFILHFYMLVSSVGWMMPLIPSVGPSIVCRNDGALQVRKPQIRVGEAIWCVVAFSLIYFPLLAASITSISFFYSILSVVKHYANCCLNKDVPSDSYQSSHKSYKKLPFLTKKIGFSLRKSDYKNGKNIEDIELNEMKPNIEEVRLKLSRKGNNWEYAVSRNQTLSGQLYVILISIALLVISLTIAEIRADPVSGICVISSESITIKICLSLLPGTVFLIVKSSIIYLIIKHFRTIQRHLTIYVSCQQEIHSKRISRTTRFYVFLVLFLWTFWGFSMCTDLYIFTNEGSWHKSLINRFICKLRQALSKSLSMFENENEASICTLETKPIINVFILHNCSYFSLNVICILCSIVNRHSIVVWKNLFLSCIRAGKDLESSSADVNLKNTYIGLQNKSLLDALWNPGVFTYLVLKKRKENDDNDRCGIEEKSVTVGSVEDSSASYCIYHEDGSLRSCVSMPPIKAMSRHNVCRFSQDLSKDSQMCTNLDDFLKFTQSFLEDNSVRRSNSFAGRPCLISNQRLGNTNIPCSSFHSCSGNPLNRLTNDRAIPFHLCSRNPSINTCVSPKHLGCARNGMVRLGPDKMSKRSSKRFSTSYDRRNDNGISSRSTLNRRKQTARYSLSPKSLSKVINRNSSVTSHHADPASCHSSNFSAESYNSYNLMAQQMGGRWRDLCRTRMTLHDAMMWAKTASHSTYNAHGCSHSGLCTPHQCCVTRTTADSHCCRPTNARAGQMDQSLLVSDCCATPRIKQQVSHYNGVTSPISSNSAKDVKAHERTVLMDEDSSDQFNSEDDMVSSDNSNKSSDRGSGEFCSEDDVVSLVNSGHS